MTFPPRSGAPWVWGRLGTDPWGDFNPGRWLWFLADVEALANPAPAIGHQSFWHWNPHGG